MAENLQYNFVVKPETAQHPAALIKRRKRITLSRKIDVLAQQLTINKSQANRHNLEWCGFFRRTVKVGRDAK